MPISADLKDNAPGILMNSFGPFSGHVLLQEVALLSIKFPAAFRLNEVDRAKKRARGEIFEKKRAESLVACAITAKIHEPLAGRLNGTGELRRSASYFTAASTVITPACSRNSLSR